MSTRRQRRLFTARIGVLLTVAGLLLAGCSSSGGGAGQADADGKYDIVMSNNDASISWRQQMINGVQYVADNTFADEVNYELRQSDNTVTAQVASLQQIIRQQPDAILIDAGSDTALTNVLQQACDQGIVVVNFDQIASQVDCSYKVRFPSEDQATDAAHWMCQQLGGQGNVLMDQAIAGLPIPQMQNEAMERVFAEDCPDVKVVGTYQSQYSPGAELQAVSSQLSSGQEIDGVMSLAYCSSVNDAFANAGLDPVPSTCVAANSNAISCDEEAVPCFMWASTPVIASLALQQAVDILNGDEVEQDRVGISQTYTINGDTDFEHVLDTRPLVEGEDYFPDASPDLILPVTVDDLGITPEVAISG